MAVDVEISDDFEVLPHQKAAAERCRRGDTVVVLPDGAGRCVTAALLCKACGRPGSGAALWVCAGQSLTLSSRAVAEKLLGWKGEVLHPGVPAPRRSKILESIRHFPARTLLVCSHEVFLGDQQLFPSGIGVLVVDASVSHLLLSSSSSISSGLHLAFTRFLRGWPGSRKIVISAPHPRLRETLCTTFPGVSVFTPHPHPGALHGKRLSVVPVSPDVARLSDVLENVAAGALTTAQTTGFLMRVTPASLPFSLPEVWAELARAKASHREMQAVNDMISACLMARQLIVSLSFGSFASFLAKDTSLRRGLAVERSQGFKRGQGKHPVLHANPLLAVKEEARRLSASPGTEHPKVGAMLREVSGWHDSKGPPARSLVVCSLQEGVKTLHDCLKSNLSTVRSAALPPTASKREAAAVVEAWEKGHAHPCLVASSAGLPSVLPAITPGMRVLVLLYEACQFQENDFRAVERAVHLPGEEVVVVRLCTEKEAARVAEEAQEAAALVAREEEEAEAEPGGGEEVRIVVLRRKKRPPPQPQVPPPSLVARDVTSRAVGLCFTEPWPRSLGSLFSRTLPVTSLSATSSRLLRISLAISASANDTCDHTLLSQTRAIKNIRLRREDKKKLAAKEEEEEVSPPGFFSEETPAVPQEEVPPPPPPPPEDEGEEEEAPPEEDDPPPPPPLQDPFEKAGGTFYATGVPLSPPARPRRVPSPFESPVNLFNIDVNKVHPRNPRAAAARAEQEAAEKKREEEVLGWDCVFCCTHNVPGSLVCSACNEPPAGNEGDMRMEVHEVQPKPDAVAPPPVLQLPQQPPLASPPLMRGAAALDRMQQQRVSVPGVGDVIFPVTPSGQRQMMQQQQTRQPQPQPQQQPHLRQQPPQLHPHPQHQPPQQMQQQPQLRQPPQQPPQQVQPHLQHQQPQPYQHPQRQQHPPQQVQYQQQLRQVQPHPHQQQPPQVNQHLQQPQVHSHPERPSQQMQHNQLQQQQPELRQPQLQPYPQQQHLQQVQRLAQSQQQQLARQQQPQVHHQQQPHQQPQWQGLQRQQPRPQQLSQKNPQHLQPQQLNSGSKYQQQPWRLLQTPQSPRPQQPANPSLKQNPSPQEIRRRQQLQVLQSIPGFHGEAPVCKQPQHSEPQPQQPQQLSQRREVPVPQAAPRMFVPAVSDVYGAPTPTSSSNNAPRNPTPPQQPSVLKPNPSPPQQPQVSQISQPRASQRFRLLLESPPRKPVLQSPPPQPRTARQLFGDDGDNVDGDDMGGFVNPFSLPQTEDREEEKGREPAEAPPPAEARSPSAQVLSAEWHVDLTQLGRESLPASDDGDDRKSSSSTVPAALSQPSRKRKGSVQNDGGPTATQVKKKQRRQAARALRSRFVDEAVEVKRRKKKKNKKTATRIRPSETSESFSESAVGDNSSATTDSEDEDDDVDLSFVASHGTTESTDGVHYRARVLNHLSQLESDGEGNIALLPMQLETTSAEASPEGKKRASAARKVVKMRRKRPRNSFDELQAAYEGTESESSIDLAEGDDEEEEGEGEEQESDTLSGPIESPMRLASIRQQQQQQQQGILGRCFKCGQHGHWAVSCPLRQQPVVPPSAANSTPTLDYITRAVGGAYDSSLSMASHLTPQPPCTSILQNNQQPHPQPPPLQVRTVPFLPAPTGPSFRL